jgi:hypothetical protein
MFSYSIKGTESEYHDQLLSILYEKGLVNIIKNYHNPEGSIITFLKDGKECSYFCVHDSGIHEFKLWLDVSRSNKGLNKKIKIFDNDEEIAIFESFSSLVIGRGGKRGFIFSSTHIDPNTLYFCIYIYLERDKRYKLITEIESNRILSGYIEMTNSENSD